MTALAIGDHVEIEGREFEIWSISLTRTEGQCTARMELADPFQAARWREEARAKQAQTELFSSGLGTRVMEKSEKALE